MATKTDVVTVAKNYFRDFPKFFQVVRPKVGYTYELGHPNIDSTASGFYVAIVDKDAPSTTALTSSQYTMDDRNGILRIDQSVDLSAIDEVIVEGNKYEWLLPADFDFYADMSIDMHMHNLSISLSNAAPVVVKVLGINTVVQALWGLLTEYARDVDVIASESVHIQASQRYRMVQSLLAFWQEEYAKLAKSLNIGIDNIQVFNLRRRSRTTNHLVPVYKEREIGDRTPLERVWADTQSSPDIELEDEDDGLRTEVLIDGDPPAGYQSGAYFPGIGPY